MSDNIKTISDDELEKMSNEAILAMAHESAIKHYQEIDTTLSRFYRFGFEHGFRKSESLRSVQWPSEEEVIAEAKSSTFKYIPNSIDYESGFVNCYAWIKDRVMTGK